MLDWFAVLDFDRRPNFNFKPFWFWLISLPVKKILLPIICNILHCFILFTKLISLLNSSRPSQMSKPLPNSIRFPNHVSAKKDQVHYVYKGTLSWWTRPIIGHELTKGCLLLFPCQHPLSEPKWISYHNMLRLVKELSAFCSYKSLMYCVKTFSEERRKPK